MLILLFDLLFLMIFLINCSNLKVGGGLQVADSICSQLNKFTQHLFIVVLSSYLTETKKRIKDYDNVEEIDYTIPNTFNTIVLGRDAVLDELVKKYHIQAVLTVFGPSRWCPSVPHISGFALPQLVIPESPYFMRMGYYERFKWRIWCIIRQWSINRSAHFFWTENQYITDRLYRLLGSKRIYTITNYYNQVYDIPEIWTRNVTLPKFDGVTCLSISAHYPHKNFEILIEIVRILKKEHPNFQVRFVLTFEEKEMPIPDKMKSSFIFVGKVNISECPYLYEQSDIMFMPTLLECFTATYPEAMRMEKPIVTTDMDFAQGLCGDAACYYSAVDPMAAAEAIYLVGSDKKYAKKLVANGKKQLAKFDNYEQRAIKLISILEKL